MNRCGIFRLNWIVWILPAFFLMNCAQIGVPTGGARDTTAPVFVKANPPIRSTDFSGNNIQLTFDEYVDVQDLQQHLFVSPSPKSQPIVRHNLRTVTIKLQDTLLPNTTYSIQFGNAIRDINEGNILKNFTYVFSTGKSIDSLSIMGKVTLAENGKTDSTLLVMLYRDAPDSAVKTRRPDYATRLDGAGLFRFNNLPAVSFKLYALKDGDGNRFYNAGTELFAFLGAPISAAENPTPVELFAYATSKPVATSAAASKTPEKKLRYTNNIIGGSQDLFSPVVLTFNNPIQSFLKDSLRLLDTAFRDIPNVQFVLDSTRRKLDVQGDWKAGQAVSLCLPTGAFVDSAGNQLAKNDTLRFSIKNNSDYGSLKIRFGNLDMSKKPVLLFMDGDAVRWSYTLLRDTWKKDMVLPGEYEVRILYDENGNGVWDAGDYGQKKQPERAITLPEKIQVRANWDTERTFDL